MSQCVVSVVGRPQNNRRGRVVVEDEALEVDLVQSEFSARSLLERIDNDSLGVFVGGLDAKSVLMQFANQQRTSNIDSFSRYTLIKCSLDANDSDIVQFECDRLLDVESLLDENWNSDVLSLGMTHVTPTFNSFDFAEFQFTYIRWSTAEKSWTQFATLSQNICRKLNVSPTFVHVHVGETSALAVKEALKFRAFCQCTPFPSKKSAKSQELQDIRCWSLKICEATRFTPTVAGPYFINLKPHLTVGEKLIHAVVEGVSNIVSCREDASVFDFALTVDGERDGVWSPHCRIRRDGLHTYLRPDCGITFVNGQLLSDEIELHHNDRLVLGSETVMRFVNVSKDRTKSQPLVDYELCKKEFVARTDFPEPEKLDTDEEIASLKAKLDKNVAGSCLILTNPPAAFADSCVASLTNMEVGDSVLIGQGGPFPFPPLKFRALLGRDSEGFTFTSGTTTKRLSHGSRFVVGDFLFLLSDPGIPDIKKSTANFEKNDSPLFIAPTALVDVRNALFDLQWSIAMLFDFSFPLESRNARDPHSLRRAQLCDDSTVTSDKFSHIQLTSSMSMLADSIRMIGSQLSEEIHSPVAEEGAVSSLMRALHEKNRTIEQLLLGADSAMYGSWSQMENIQARLGEKLIRVAKLEAELADGQGSRSVVTESTISGGTVPTVAPPAAFQTLKSTVIISVPTVAKRFASTIELLSRSRTFHVQLERYCETLEAMIDSCGGVHNIFPHRQQAVLLSLVDVVAAFDVGQRNGSASATERALLHRRLPFWQLVAEQCAASFVKLESDSITQANRMPSTRAPSTSASVGRGRVHSSGSSQIPSRQPSPVARQSSATRKDPSPVRSVTAATPTASVRAPSPTHRSALALSPAALIRTTTVSNGAARSTPTKGRAPSPLRPPLKTSTTRDVSPGVRAPNSTISSTPSVSRPVTARAMSPKTDLTRQLMEIGALYKKR